MHATGAATVPFMDLPEDLRAAFGFDPKAAQAQREKKEALRKIDEESRQLKTKIEEAKKSSLHVRGKILSVGDGYILLSEASEYVPGNAFAGRMFPGEVICIKGSSVGLVDDEPYAAEVWPVGRFFYKSTSGGQKTVTAFTPSLEYYIKVTTSGEHE